MRKKSVNTSKYACIFVYDPFTVQIPLPFLVVTEKSTPSVQKNKNYAEVLV
jgi:hypothetical protein